jgi:serine/threonine-protein kinase
MSHEQARGEPATPAADVFSLGLVLYELAAGRPPFRVDSIAAALRAVISEPIAPPSRFHPEIPVPLEALILRMLQRDHRLRPSAAEVAKALGAPAARPPHRLTPAHRREAMTNCSRRGVPGRPRVDSARL